MTRISSISVKGLRGVRDSICLEANQRSVLIYGNNGTGKSTLADVTEWFYFDRVDHLVSEEIGRKGYEALRNIHISDGDTASVEFRYNDSTLDCEKTIVLSNGKLVCDITNQSTTFAQYLRESARENLVLRYKDLLRFVTSTKGDKLRDLSEIIGFSEVTKTRDTLQKVANQLSREITSRGIPNQIGIHQSQILEQFGQNVASDEEFIEIVNELVKGFDLCMKVRELKDVNSVLKLIRKPDDTKEVKRESYLEATRTRLVNLPVNLDELHSAYEAYKERFDSIAKDVEKLRKLALEQLLRVGKGIVAQPDYDYGICPLCLQDKEPAELAAEIDQRLSELEGIKREDHELKKAKADLREQMNRARRIVQSVSDDEQTRHEENRGQRRRLSDLTEAIGKYNDQLSVEVGKGQPLLEPKTLAVDRQPLNEILRVCESELRELRKQRTKDPKWDAHAKIKIAGNAYAQIRRLVREQAAYERQRDTMEEIFRRFLEKQRESLSSFLKAYSTRIDTIYQFLNPGERVENIRLAPISKNGDLVGLTIVYDFQTIKGESPPHKYMSESQLNSLGLAIFLASVEAFNNKNKFLILDDVISSYDTVHRKRFADLIVEEFQDWQVILLTHEMSWFDIVKNRVKQKGWVVLSVKHSDLDGTYLSQPPKDMKGRIEAKVANSDPAGLGNEARKYLENFLKRVACELEVKVAYRPNDRNEERMPHELISELKAKLKKTKCTELLAEKVIDRLKDSTNIANKDSHDYLAGLDFGDLKAFWIDVVEFEALFSCGDCGSLVSVAHYDSVHRKIRCKKGHLAYSWIR